MMNLFPRCAYLRIATRSSTASPRANASLTSSPTLFCTPCTDIVASMPRLPRLFSARHFMRAHDDVGRFGSVVPREFISFRSAARDVRAMYHVQVRQQAGPAFMSSGDAAFDAAAEPDRQIYCTINTRPACRCLRP